MWWSLHKYKVLIKGGGSKGWGLDLQKGVLYTYILSVRLGNVFCVSQTHVLHFSCFFFNVLSRNVWLFLWTVHTVHCLWNHKFYFSATFSLKISSTVLFTHLKIILLPCFQFLTVSKWTRKWGSWFSIFHNLFNLYSDRITILSISIFNLE